MPQCGQFLGWRKLLVTRSIVTVTVLHVEKSDSDGDNNEEHEWLEDSWVLVHVFIGYRM